jgi:hypothetical protein
MLHSTHDSNAECVVLGDGEVVYQLASIILRSIVPWTIPDHTARVRVSRLQAWGLGFGSRAVSFVGLEIQSNGPLVTHLVL